MGDIGERAVFTCAHYSAYGLTRQIRRSRAVAEIVTPSARRQCGPCALQLVRLLIDDIQILDVVPAESCERVKSRGVEVGAREQGGGSGLVCGVIRR